MSSNNLDRRTVLRGMVMAICTMCLPKVLWGAQTTPGKAKGGKVSKVQAKYQEKPKGKQKCSNCINFIPPASCKLVEGKINPNGWCMLWAKKQA